MRELYANTIDGTEVVVRAYDAGEPDGCLGFHRDEVEVVIDSGFDLGEAVVMQRADARKMALAILKETGWI